MKLLMTPYVMRRMALSKLREKLGELQALRDGGDYRDEVHATFVAISKEIERREAAAPAKVKSLISKGASKLMRIGDIRAKIAELRLMEQTEEVRNTIAILSEETGRRSMLAKRTYWRRKGEAQAFLSSMAAKDDPRQLSILDAIEECERRRQ